MTEKNVETNIRSSTSHEKIYRNMLLQFCIYAILITFHKNNPKIIMNILLMFLFSFSGEFFTFKLAESRSKSKQPIHEPQYVEWIFKQF